HSPAARLFPIAPTRLEWIALEVDDARHELVLGSRNEAPGAFVRDRENQLPVFVAHGRRRRAVVVEEGVARGLVRLARQVVDLVNAVERRFDDSLVGTFFDLRLQIVPFRSPGDFYERRQPIERREDIAVDRSRFDVPWPANDAGSAHAALPGVHLRALERR